MRLVLASTSRYRRALIARLGLDVTCVAPRCDEEKLKPTLAHLDVPQQALALARAKAESVLHAHRDALVIGSDQIASRDGVVLDKPGTRERAAAQLASLSGRAHTLHTAVVVLRGDDRRAEEHVETHTLWMRALDAATIARYLDRDGPLDCCGSYRVESLGIALFERIVGEDPSAIEGLPLMRLSAMLARLGVDPLGGDRLGEGGPPSADHQGHEDR